MLQNKNKSKGYYKGSLRVTDDKPMKAKTQTLSHLGKVTIFTAKQIKKTRLAAI
jgi:hypothetical protein